MFLIWLKKIEKNLLLMGDDEVLVLGGPIKGGVGGGGYLCFAMSTVFLMDRLFESDKLFNINFHFFDISPNLLLPKVNWAISIQK